jgi:hypothetical protein
MRMALDRWVYYTQVTPPRIVGPMWTGEAWGGVVRDREGANV